MGRLRIAILIFFIAVATFFSASYIYDKITSDTTAPVITAESDELEVSVAATDEDLLAGMRATDNVDGDITDSLVVASKSKFIEPGTIHVNYAAFDSSNNVGTKTRTVRFTDYTAPHFRMTAPMRFSSGASSYDYLEHVSAEDCIDGDITRQIKINFGQTNAVSDTVIQQKMNMQVTNSFGDSAVIDMVVSMEDYTTYNKPSPSLSDYIIYTKVGKNINFSALIDGIWTAGVKQSFSETDFTAQDISFYTGSLDLNTPGIYKVVYQLTREHTEWLGSATLYVIVEG